MATSNVNDMIACAANKLQAYVNCICYQGPQVLTWDGLNYIVRDWMTVCCYDMLGFNKGVQ